jgi:hypothetical protein
VKTSKVDWRVVAWAVAAPTTNQAGGLEGRPNKWVGAGAGEWAGEHIVTIYKVCVDVCGRLVEVEEAPGHLCRDRYIQGS